MTVYAIQQQMRLDNTTNELVPKFDLGPANKYGEVHYVVSPSLNPFDTDKALMELRLGLQEIKEGDHLLLIGNPILIGLTTLVASEFVDRIFFLQWSGKQRAYVEVETFLQTV